MAKKLNLKITGDRTMHCPGCSSSVEFSLKMLPGVGQVNADVESQVIEVELISDETGIEQVMASLDMIGYETAPV